MSTQSENVKTVEQYEQNEKGEKKLMNKTKKELIDIIFRKDDVENKLRKEKSDIELDFNKAKDMIAKKDGIIINKDNTIKNLESQLKVKDNVISGDKDEITSLQMQYEDMRNQSISRGVWNIVLLAVIAAGVILHFMF